MGELTLIKRNGETIPLFSQEPFCTVRSAQQSVSLMGDDTVTLDIVSSDLITFDKGDKIIVDGDEYSIRTTVNREKVSDNHYNYKPVFYGVIYELMKTLYRNTDVNGRSDKSVFTLTYTMKDFMRVLIYNLERDYHGIWQFDVANCPDTEAKTISFNRQNCLKTLQDLCSKENFNLDFQITQDNGVRTIHIGKFGALVNPPGGGDFFEWGKGNGVYTLKEEKVDDKTIKTRLWVEGGIKNIRSEYRDYAGALQLPYPKRLNAHAHTLRDGTVVEAGTEMIGIDDDTKRYLEDAELAAMLGTDEDANSYDNIYPKRTGEVTALAYKTDKQTGQQVLDVNSFIDSTMDFDLAETDASGNTKYLIAGVSAKITFISGKLSGQEFELELKNGYNHSERKFTIIPFQDERGLVTPTVDTDAFRIGVGDQYKITDIHLPKAYEDDAEEDLWYEAIQDFNEIRQVKAKYSLEFDRMYFMENTPSDATACIFKVGDYAPVRDTRFGIEKSIRITNVQRNLLVRQDYNITLSDTWAIAVATQAVIDVGRHETIINASGIKDLTRAKRGWRTTEELRNMIYDTDGYFDPEHIRPLSIDTNMLTVGSKSQQFILTGAILEANKNGNPNVFSASSCVLSHLTIQEEGVRSWNISAQDFTLAESGGYYLFAKCSKSGNNGTWYLTQEQLKAEETSDPNNYYFQVGVLGSCYQDDAFRDFVTTYGFTRINGNTITTGKIVTSDGYCYLDLDGNAFRIGDAHSSIDWNVTARGQLTLRNVRLLSDSGDTSEIGVYRGEYNPDYIYYKGDEVSYTDGGQTCTYRYKNLNPSKGHLPTNSTYWEILARGAAGETGNSIFYTFNDSLEKPAVPTGSGNTGGWHTNSTDAVVWMSIKSAKVISEGSWGTPFKVKGADGTSIVPKGSKNSVADLPTTGNSPGDCYFVNGYLYVWDGLTWINNGKIKGDPGTSSYLHLKYSNDGGQHFTDGQGEVPGRWIGMYVDQSVTDSDNPADYSWRDAQGEQGIPGEDGEDGRTTYLHLKYSNNGGLSFTGNNGEDPGAYIGQYTDFEEMDSSDPTMYKWSRLTGTAGAAGADSAAGDYYEYRYAKNGSTVAPPELNPNDPDPYGWTKTMPQVGALEYLWCTMCRKSALVDRTRVDIPVSNVDGLHDFSGNGYNGYIGSNTIVTDGDHDALQMTGQNDSRIPYDLPFGESFTLCLFMKVTTTPVKWIICGYNGADYVEKTLNLNANTWYHLAFRFNDTTCTLFINGEQSDISVVSERLVGFSVYDDNLFGSTTLIRGVRILKGALAQSDIVAVLTGSIDQILQPWSTPFRINPYDGKDGVAVSVSDVDVEYAKSSSNSEAPTSGWSTDAPTWENGKYIWSRTKVTYSNGEETTTKPACITGTQGNNGVGVSSIVEQYYRSSSSQTLSDGSWLTYNPGWVNGWFIWTRSVISYTNGTGKITTPICVTGSRGEQGNPGKDAAYIHVLGSGLNNSMNAYIKIFNGVSERTVQSNLRGLTVYTVERYTMELIDTRNFDTYGSDDAINNMVTYLNGLNATVFVCIVSYDAVGWNDNLVNALAQFGCAGVQNTEKGRFPFAFIGVKGLPAGYALMMQKNDESSTPPAEVITYVADGVFATSRDGKDGKDGVDGKSPVLVFRGNYNDSGSVTYYGTSHRVDAVKYNGVYYIARVDAGTFNTVPTDESKWNPFGAQFESIATNLLLAENANIAGWVFRNNRLESQNGSMYMDGVRGSVRLGGTLLMSTGFGGHENLEDFNIFYLQGVSKTTTIVVNSGVEHIGKVIKIFNTGTFSQGDYKIRLTNFSVEEDESGSITEIGTNYEAVLRPQEVLEATCFRVPSSGNAVKGSWEITSRFAQTDFKADSGVRGRYAMILGIGRYSSHSGGLSGTWWNNKGIGSILSVTRLGEGRYKISFKESDIPAGSKFMVCGYGGNGGVGNGNAVFANVFNESWNGNNSWVEIRTADDSSLNDGGFEFTIFGTNWSYTLYN